MEPLTWHYEDYTISTDKTLLSPQIIHELLHSSYWAQERSCETILKSIEHSLCYGVYYDGQQVGFARIVTDYTTMYWLCDVFIHTDHRKKQLGKLLMKCITETPEIRHLRGMLATKDAHGLYKKFGFETVNGKFMVRIPS